MLDPGRYFAEAIYFLQYMLAQLLWAVDRSLLSIAVIVESVDSWISDNIGYFVELLVNALSAPLGGMLILALVALGAWYALNNVVVTTRWVDPSKLFTYGLIALFFFSSPIVMVDMMEQLRTSLTAGVDQALIDGAAGDIFNAGMNGTDSGLPAAIPDVNSDGVLGSFDLAAAFMGVANIDELDSSEFPLLFESAYFPFGDPSGIDLSDEADQELAKALASDGIERLFFALVAIPTAIAEHFLRLSLTGVALFLYMGVPFAMLFAFFVYTQAFMGAYLRQFVNLLLETFMSVIIGSVMIGLLMAAAQQGIGLYIAASIIVGIVLTWRIKSAMKLGASAFDLFGGAMMSGGESGMGIARMGRQAVTGAAGMAGAALTGGATMAIGGAMMASASAVQADGKREGGLDSSKTDGRVRQLKTIAGYSLGKSESVRHVIEGAHEVRTLARNFRDGEAQTQEAGTLDYLRAGSSMSGFGSSPWLAMRMSSSLRSAYDQIGGARNGSGAGMDDEYDDEGEPVSMTDPVGASTGESVSSSTGGSGRSEPQSASGQSDRTGRRRNSKSSKRRSKKWRAKPATSNQINYLTYLAKQKGESSQIPDKALTRGEASDLIDRFMSSDSGDSTTDNVTTRSSTARSNATGRSSNNTHSSDGHSTGSSDDSPDGASPRGQQILYVSNTSGRAASPTTGNSSAQASRHQQSTPAQPAPLAVSQTIRLEPYGQTRRQAVAATLTRLGDENAQVRRGGQQTLVTFTGEQNAERIQTAVTQHTAAAVQEATTATANLVADYRSQQMSDGDILSTFQSGEAAATMRETADSPLSDEQLTAVADMVLLPQRRLARTELVTVIGEQAAAGQRNETAVSDAIGSPVSFGGQTGAIRGVMAGAGAMKLSPEELTRLAALIRDGMRQEAGQQLVAQGHQPAAARALISDIAALPATMVVPQSSG